MARLSVNVDHVATLRQARMVDYPDPLEAALLAEAAGATGITIHLREDRRHIQDHDLRRIKRGIATKLNLEMAADPNIIKIACKAKPWQVTFVPERRQEVTTEGGLDVTRRRKKWREIVETFRQRKILVSLFIDPVSEQVEASALHGADAIEINTAAYSEATTQRSRRSCLKKIESAITLANNHGLLVHAGHGLTMSNIAPVAALPVIDELNIGHSIVARAVMIGFSAAVKEMAAAINNVRVR